MKKILTLVTFVMVGIMATTLSVKAMGEQPPLIMMNEPIIDPVTIYINCDGGSYEEAPGRSTMAMENILYPGESIGSKFLVKDPTCPGKQFQGWYIYNKDTGAQLGGGKLYTTQEVLNFVMPEHAVHIKAQWTGKTITSITYGCLHNKTGEIDYNAKVTIIYNGISYSGQGFVNIQESVYSSWTGEIQVIFEFPGEYVNADNQYVKDIQDWGMMSVAEFKRQKNCFHIMYQESGEREVFPPRSAIDNFYTYADTVAPIIGNVNTSSASDVISDTSIVPATYSVMTTQYDNGEVYDKAVAAAQNTYGSSDVLVYNIDLKDENGSLVHQLSGTVDVKLSVPSTFTVNPGKRVVVYYLNEDGTLEECETTYDDATKTVIFKTNHFSVYVVAQADAIPEPTPEVIEEVITEDSIVEDSDTEEKVEDENNTSKNDKDNKKDNKKDKNNKDKGNNEVVDSTVITENSNNNSLVWIIIGVVLIIAGILVIVIKKRK